MKVLVTFTETVTRTLPFEVKALDEYSDEGIDDLDYGELHEMMDAENAWSQIAPAQLAEGDIESREIDEFTTVFTTRSEYTEAVEGSSRRTYNI